MLPTCAFSQFSLSYLLADLTEPGVDIVVNFSSPVAACLAPALAIFDQGPWSSNDISSPDDLQNIQQLVERWDLDLLNFGWDPVSLDPVIVHYCTSDMWLLALMKLVIS